MTYPSQSLVKNLRDATLKIVDATATELTCTVALLEGDLAWSRKQSVNVIKDRGTLHNLRKGDEEACSVSFSVKFTGCYSESAGDPSPYEALTNEEDASVWVSTTAATSDLYTVDLLFSYVDPGSADGVEYLNFTDFAVEDISFKEGDEYNTLSVSGIALCTGPAISSADPYA